MKIIHLLEAIVLINIILFYGCKGRAPLENSSVSNTGYCNIRFINDCDNTIIQNCKVIVAPYWESFRLPYASDSSYVIYSDSLGQVKIPTAMSRMYGRDNLKVNLYFYDSTSLYDIPQVFVVGNLVNDTSFKVVSICPIYFKIGKIADKNFVDVIRFSFERKVSNLSRGTFTEYRKVFYRERSPSCFVKDSTMLVEFVRPNEILEAKIQVGNQVSRVEKFVFQYKSKYVIYL